MSAFIQTVTRYCEVCDAPIVRHRDGNKRYESRRFCTRQCKYLSQMKGGKVARDPKHRWLIAKLTESQVEAIRELRWIGRMRYADLCVLFNRGHGTIWQAANGATWKHVPMPKQLRSPAIQHDRMAA